MGARHGGMKFWTTRTKLAIIFACLCSFSTTRQTSLWSATQPPLFLKKECWSALVKIALVLSLPPETVNNDLPFFRSLRPETTTDEDSMYNRPSICVAAGFLESAVLPDSFGICFCIGSTMHTAHLIWLVASGHASAAADNTIDFWPSILRRSASGHFGGLWRPAHTSRDGIIAIP